MSKNIRTFAKELFIALSAKRLAGEFGPIDTYLAKGNTAFRKAITDAIEVEFGVKISSSSTAYNFAKVHCEKNHPELVVGLGRPADKKGGRKPKAVVVADPAVASDAAASATSAATDTPTTPVVEAVKPANKGSKRANKKAVQNQVAA